MRAECSQAGICRRFAHKPAERPCRSAWCGLGSSVLRKKGQLRGTNADSRRADAVRCPLG
jgi:hypothetical protein